MLSDPPFDVDLFAYYEDVDLAWRLTNQGWRHLYRPQAIAYHDRRGPDSKPGTLKPAPLRTAMLFGPKTNRFLSFSFTAQLLSRGNLLVCYVASFVIPLV